MQHTLVSGITIFSKLICFICSMSAIRISLLIIPVMTIVFTRRQEISLAHDLIVTGSGDCTAKAWSLDTAKCVRTFTGHLGAINTMATDNTGRTLFTGSMDQTIRSFEVATGRPLFIFRGHDGPVLYIAVSCCIDGLFIIN